VLLPSRRLFASIVATFSFLFAVFAHSTAYAEAPPQQTTVGVYVEQVSAIDLKANTFTVDFWVWFRSSGRSMSPIESFEIIEGRVNSKSNIIKKKLPDGQDYAAARINATIHRQWDLHRYPFDDHTLEIAIEDADLDVGHSVFVADGSGQGLDPDVAVSGWDITGFRSSVTDHLYHSNYGDTSLTLGTETRYSRYVVDVDAKRRGIARFFKVVFALLVSVFVSWCAFFIRPKDASPRVSVSVGALFAGAAGTIAINNALPDINYPTLTDKTIYLCLGMILLSLFGTVISLSLHYLGREADHRRIDKAGAIAFPLLFAVLLLMVVR
jgi:hypothetical protein